MVVERSVLGLLHTSSGSHWPKCFVDPPIVHLVLQVVQVLLGVVFQVVLLLQASFSALFCGVCLLSVLKQKVHSLVTLKSMKSCCLCSREVVGIVLDIVPQ